MRVPSLVSIFNQKSSNRRLEDPHSLIYTDEDERYEEQTKSQPDTENESLVATDCLSKERKKA